MSRKFFSSLFLLVLLNVLVKPVWIFGIDRQVQNIAGTVAYGQYFALFNLSFILNFFLDAGLTTAWNQRAAQNREWLHQHYGTAASLKLLLGLLYGVLLLIAGLFTGTDHSDWLLILGLNQFLFSFLLFLRNTLTALQWFKTDAWVSVADKTLMLIACGAMLLFPALPGQLSITRFLITQTITVTAVIMVVMIILRYKAKLIFPAGPLINKQLLKDALPFGIIVLLMSMHNRADGYLLDRLHKNGAYEAGIYAGAYRLLDAAAMAGFLVTSFLLPFIARNRDDGGLIRKTVFRLSALILGFAATGVFTVLLFADHIQTLLYHHSDPYSAGVLRWCIASLIAYTAVQIYGTVLTALGHSRLFIQITLIAVCLNLLLNSLLIPFYGAQGAAATAFITQTLYGILLSIAAHKKMKSLRS